MNKHIKVIYIYANLMNIYPGEIDKLKEEKKKLENIVESQTKISLDKKNKENIIL